MNCFPCCASKKSFSKREHGSTHQETTVTSKPTVDMKKQKGEETNQQQGDTGNIEAQSFTFRELATATKNFRQECLLGEGGFGKIYKGVVPTTGQAVAVKQLDRHGMNGKEEFLSEVMTLSLLHHENLVNLIGYCADGDQRLLVYELYRGCTLEDRLLEKKTDQPPLDWYDRMKIAAGTSKGLEYLHESANPPVIYRDLKGSNVLLDNDNHVKLCDFGMAKLSGGDKMNHAPPRVVGTFGYCAPEYVRTGQFTMKSDVYSFGVILLELITGRRAIDTTRPNDEQNLVSWAQPLFRDPKRFPEMADPLLRRSFPEKDLNQAVAIAAMCLQEEPEARPLISDVVTALSFLSTAPPEGIPPSLPAAASVSRKSRASAAGSETGSEIVSDSEAGSAKGSLRRHSSYYGSGREGHKSSRRHAAASAKYRDSDVSDIEDSHHSSSRSSRRSSSRSRKATLSSESGDGSVSSSGKSSKKSHKLSQKSSKKSDAVDLTSSQKSSRKSSMRERDSSHKTSRKSSVRISSHKSSMRSEDESVSSSRRSSSVASEDGYEHNSMKLSHSDHSNSRRTDEESIQLDHTISMGSDEGSGHPFDHSSSSGSYKGSVH